MRIFRRDKAAEEGSWRPPRTDNTGGGEKRPHRCPCFYLRLVLYIRGTKRQLSFGGSSIIRTNRQTGWREGIGV